ncbi:hypothetical protein CSA56_09280 [candidate division KSB3 bacterium]|uniref:C4-dicarboxylate ABC transporter substrate-binding protein n=1 Tax=candidate division KSB3 bacterium TaxID=2044937 RepID=A0A2G6KFC1_9BACT|nr:MAG: hypothetical protein CSA56_09280 [candidate division KSB3 bacterium]
MKRVLVLSVIVAVVAVSLVSYAAQDVIELKLGSKMPENNPESQGVLRVCELVEERSNGRLKIIPYFGEALGNKNTQLENVMMGTQDMYIESYSHYVSWVPGFAVHSLPYLFSGAEQYQQFLLSDLEKELEQKLLDKTGIKILNTKKNWVRGPYRVLVSKKPIFSPADLAGVKLRMADSRLLSNVWNGLGANVINLAWSEVYLALQQGVVEAVTSPVSLLYSMKFTEICKYVIRTDEYNQQLALVINNKKFESLPEDLQKILVDTIDEVGEYVSGLVYEAANKDLEKMKQEHGMEYAEPDISPWLDKMPDIFSTLEKEGLIPKEAVEKVLAWQKTL